MAKILFFPNYLGGGFGHVSRCVALADTFFRRGDEVAFALNGPHLKRVSSLGYSVFRVPTPVMHQATRRQPAYIYLPGLEYQVVRDGFDNPDIVKQAFFHIHGILKKVMPDVLIGDGYLLTGLLGKYAHIPVVQLSKSVVHPEAEKMAWWEPEPDDMIQPDAKPVFNPLLKKLDLPEITNAYHLLTGDLYLLPGLYDLDPMTPLPEKTFYVGGIIRRGTSGECMPDWFSRLNGAQPVIYVTVGGAAGHGGGRRFFEMVANAFMEKPWQVVVSTGGKPIPENPGSRSSNVRLVRWVPGMEMIKRSDLVIFHGGYSRMEILLKGIPSIIIPFHSEQEYYGRVMEKTGVGRMIPYSDQPYVRLKKYWKGGNRWRKSKLFTLHVRPRMTLRPEMLRDLSEDVLADEKMKMRAEAVKMDLETVDGCEKAIEIIKRELNVQ